ncbi:hypothetical protein Tco_0969674 [Tanacetum coccineum]
MSDSEHSTVTYTEVSCEFKDLSDVGSPGVIVYGYDGLPIIPEDPYAYVEAALQSLPSLDYVPGPEEPEQAPPPPDFVHEPVYLEFMPPKDDVLSAEEQPLPADISPADSPGYITESDPEEDPKEEDDEDPEEDPTNYPTDRDDKEEEESSGDDADDEEEEHLASADSIPSPPLPISPSPLPASPTHSLGYRAAMIRLRAESPSTSHPLPLSPPIILPRTMASMAMMRVSAPSTYYLAPPSGTPPSGTPPLLPIPLPTSSPPLLLPSTDCRADVPEVTLPPRKRLCIAPGPRFKVREFSSTLTARPTGGFRADYGFVGTLDAEIRRDPDREIGRIHMRFIGYGITDIREDPDEIAEEILATDVAELGQRMTDFVTTVRQDTDEIYERLDDAQDNRLLMSGQLNLLRRDRRSHARMTRLMESKARASREAWLQSMDANDTTRYETQMVVLQSQQRHARDPTYPDVPEETGSSSLIWLCLSYFV